MQHSNMATRVAPCISRGEHFSIFSSGPVLRVNNFLSVPFPSFSIFLLFRQPLVFVQFTRERFNVYRSGIRSLMKSHDLFFSRLDVCTNSGKRLLRECSKNRSNHRRGNVMAEPFSRLNSSEATQEESEEEKESSVILPCDTG